MAKKRQPSSGRSGAAKKVRSEKNDSDADEMSEGSPQQTVQQHASGRRSGRKTKVTKSYNDDPFEGVDWDELTDEAKEALGEEKNTEAGLDDDSEDAILDDEDDEDEDEDEDDAVDEDNVTEDSEEEEEKPQKKVTRT